MAGSICLTMPCANAAGPCAMRTMPRRPMFTPSVSRRMAYAMDASDRQFLAACLPVCTSVRIVIGVLYAKSALKAPVIVADCAREKLMRKVVATLVVFGLGAGFGVWTEVNRAAAQRSTAG